jgi:hypothetical protein
VTYLREEKPKRNESDSNDGRRRFLRGAAMAGVLGAVGITPGVASSSAAAQQTPTENSDMPPDVKADIERRAKDPSEFPKPAGQRANSMLDARFPVYYKVPVVEAVRVLTEYFAAFAERNVSETAGLLHYPYATYEGVEPIIYKSAEEFISSPPPSLNVTKKDDVKTRPGTYDTLTRPGTYDILDNLQLHTFNPVNVGLELCYTRYRADGHKLGINQGIYAITNNDGKWAIQLSSVIFTPSDYVGVNYSDALEAQLRQSRTGMADLSYHDVDLIRDRGVGGLPSNTGSGGRVTASITGDPGADNWLIAGRAGVPMEPFNTEGVKSRLRISDPNNPANNFTGAVSSHTTSNHWIAADGKSKGYFYPLAGEGAVVYAYTLTLPDARVLHASSDKAHTIGGYIRFTNDNEVISETRSLGIMVYDLKRGFWGSGSSYGQMTRRDCTNDVRNG